MRFVLTCAAVLMTLGTTTIHAAGDAAAGQQKSVVCAACHGADGNSANAMWPKLAGQHAGYLERQLVLFKEGELRENAQMTGMVAALQPQDMADLAAYYASMAPSGGFASEDQVALGRKIFQAGKAKVGAASCMSCHGPTGLGDPSGVFPRLAGQYATYVAAQLKAFRAGERSSDPNRMMRDVVQWLTDAEIDAVAEYVAGLR